jgi:hypothetical protein
MNTYLISFIKYFYAAPSVFKVCHANTKEEAMEKANTYLKDNEDIKSIATVIKFNKNKKPINYSSID